MLALALAACTPDPPPQADSGAVDAPTADVPPLAEALAEVCAIAPVPSARPGDDLHRVTLTDATARCNDGTPPVVWVRAATDPAHAADWVVHLEGGGMCRTAEECAARWCGTARPYDASNMSSAWAPEAVGGPGIFSATPGNTFAGWNVVRVHYCTSDLWLGTAGDAVFADGDPPFRLPFQGHDVVGAVLDTLAAGATSDDAAEALPSLTAAERVVFSGSSAGAWGAALHGWRVVEALPGAQVVVAVDAAFSPAPEIVPAERLDAWTALVQDRWALGTDLWRISPQPACLEAHAEAPWRCMDATTALREQLPAGSAYHHDLRDPVLYGFLAETGASLDEYAAWGADTLALLRQERPDLSLHGSVCGEHTVVDADPTFFGLRVVDAVDGGAAVSFHQVLGGAADGVRGVAIDAVEGSGSRCPP